MNQIDLSNCDREPIHIPGKIQSHGFLISISKDFRINYCSENIKEFTDIDASKLLSEPVEYLETVVLNKMAGFIASLIDIAHTEDGFRPVNPYPVAVGNGHFNLIICDSADQYLLEFEPAGSDLEPAIDQSLGRTLSVILSDSKLPGLLEKTARHVRSLIDYDRVMVYKFHDDGHGEVVAESKSDDLDPWLGLHYPATDIPQQARELYKHNLVRLIADVHSVPSNILTHAEFSGQPLDLTTSTLRAVSPIHIQYLKNMGVASSFSVSLIHEGELWGLIACHNYTPRYIHYKQREASKLIGQVLSSALSFLEQEEGRLKNHQLSRAVEELTRYLLRYNNLEDALFNHDVTLLDAVDAAGVVLSYDNRFYKKGITPEDRFLKPLLEWLAENVQESIYSTNRLPSEYLPAEECKASASGILACRLSRELNEYIIWFKPELITTVSWAGDPDKPFEIAERGINNISPRKSFETWTETVRSTSAQWTSADRQSALEIKEEVAFAISRKANEIRLLNERLKEAYDELDAFSYTISHDLKSPLTTIKSYSQLLRRSVKLEARDQTMIDGILNGADKMHSMIEEVLHYSKAGQLKTQRAAVDMTSVLSDLKEQLLVANADASVVIELGSCPPLYGDETMIRQVFSNLLGNAVKYSSKSESPRVSVYGERIGNEIHYRVEDNGIGIGIHDQKKIFNLFTRSSEVGAYEGSGVGLAIVKKIMEKHGGRIWVESEPGIGSAFTVAFNMSQNGPD